MNILKLSFKLFVFLIILNSCIQKSPFASSLSNWGVEFGFIDSNNLIFENQYIVHYPTIDFDNEYMYISTNDNIFEGGITYKYRIIKKISDSEYIVELKSKKESKKRLIHFYFDNLKNGLDKNGCLELYIKGDGLNIYIWKCLNGVYYLVPVRKHPIFEFSGIFFQNRTHIFC